MKQNNLLDSENYNNTVDTNSLTAETIFYAEIHEFFCEFQKNVGSLIEIYPNVENYCVPGSPGGKPLLDIIVQSETSPIQKNILADVSGLFFKGLKFLHDAWLILEEYVRKDKELISHITFPLNNNGTNKLTMVNDPEDLLLAIKDFGDAAIIGMNKSNFQELVNDVEIILNMGQGILTSKGSFNLMFHQRIAALIIQKVSTGIIDIGNSYHLVDAYLQWKDTK